MQGDHSNICYTESIPEPRGELLTSTIIRIFISFTSGQGYPSVLPPYLQPSFTCDFSLISASHPIQSTMTPGLAWRAIVQMRSP